MSVGKGREKESVVCCFEGVEFIHAVLCLLVDMCTSQDRNVLRVSRSGPVAKYLVGLSELAFVRTWVLIG